MPETAEGHDMIQIAVEGRMRALVEAWVDANGWHLFPIPWEKDGELTVEPNPDDLPTFGIGFGRLS